APGQPGTPDKTSDATPQVEAFFGEAAADDFVVTGGGVAYEGPDEQSYRRFVLHNAALAAAAGGVDFFIVGSELRGLTTARADDDAFPAVAALQSLTGEVRAL